MCAPGSGREFEPRGVADEVDRPAPEDDEGVVHDQAHEVRGRSRGQDEARRVGAARGVQEPDGVHQGRDAGIPQGEVEVGVAIERDLDVQEGACLLYTSPSPRD